MSPTTSARGRRRVVALAYDGARLLDLTGPLETLATANDFGARYDVTIVSPDGAPVVTATGAGLVADCAVADLGGGLKRDHDVLIVPGGPNWPRVIHDRALIGAVRELSARSACVASICAGAFLLGAAGLLDGRRATTHWRFTTELAELFPRVTVDADALFVRDGDVVTSAGVSAGIDLTLALVEDHFGAEVARSTAKDMVVFMQRPGGQSQFSVRAQSTHARHESLRRILDTVVENPAAPHSLTSMARSAGVSVRHLNRLFREELDLTPARYVEQVRIEAAKSRLEVCDEPISTIARHAGFGSPESLRRAFSREFGVTPAAYRERFNTTNVHVS
ncbi:GlxA family transcriptional regulator [Amycolatopsis rhabdoformis]|uniref:GlxA family transcriptional regulator n=1 Tax=Amycolatopsis rhabdoformis TaxID=1448059 RepID=A0ABZ1IJS4_9PSEU|nr:GlxA family transcriptional regulator [Amycolatopsis rhabdoformis]WSE33700.1 GlxA family transcriptional regulator [Amycolatopsis rhabdoformis]